MTSSECTASPPGSGDAAGPHGRHLVAEQAGASGPGREVRQDLAGHGTEMRLRLRPRPVLPVPPTVVNPAKGWS
ncbi:MAG: hypothetical protein R2731_00810 [Nocardioides sp.]